MFKAIIKQTLFLFCILGFAVITEAQDSTYIKVHFLYGSRPLRKYKDVEAKWFGGMLGGHVGIETDSNKILNFLPEGSFHWLAKKQTGIAVTIFIATGISMQFLAAMQTV